MAACYCAGVFQRASIAGGCGKAGATGYAYIFVICRHDEGSLL
jgi:hypothetical protein